MINFNMSKRNILSLIILFFAATLTLGSPVSKDVPISIECRIMAESAKDANIIEIAKSSEKEIVINGQIKALWQPVAEDSKSRILDNNSIVTRQSDSNQLQALVLVSADDVIPKDIKRIYVSSGPDCNLLALGVSLYDFGSNKIYRLTTNNINKPIATIIDGEIEMVSPIRTSISSGFLITNKGNHKISELIKSLQEEPSLIEISAEDGFKVLKKFVIFCCALFFSFQLLKFLYLKRIKKRNLIIISAAIGAVIIFGVFGVSIQTTSELVVVHGEKIIGIKHTVLVDYIKGFCGLIGGAIVGFILVNIFDKKLKNKNT